MARIGKANCPDCGVVVITDVKNVVVNMHMGLSNPTASIRCEKCGNHFTASVNWDSAIAFDLWGCGVIGFSRRTAPAITEEDIDGFMTIFDENLENFLTFIDNERLR